MLLLTIGSFLQELSGVDSEGVAKPRTAALALSRRSTCSFLSTKISNNQVIAKRRNPKPGLVSNSNKYSKSYARLGYESRVWKVELAQRGTDWRLNQKNESKVSKVGAKGTGRPAAKDARRVRKAQKN